MGFLKEIHTNDKRIIIFNILNMCWYFYQLKIVPLVTVGSYWISMSSTNSNQDVSIMPISVIL